MKVCLIVDDYLPNSIKIGAKMMHELACELHHQGHEVTVITPSSELKESIKIEILDNITICRFKGGETKNINKVKRAINETLLSFYAWYRLKKYFKKNRHDLIIYYSPTIFWGFLVSKLKNLWRAKSYLILRDFFPQWAVDQGLIKKGTLIEKYFRFFEKKSYSVADTIGVMSQKNLEFFKKEFKINTNIEVLYNWAKSSPVPFSSTHYREKLNLQNKVVYFYGGNIGHAQDMMNIVRLAKNMQKEKKAFFILLGAGDEYSIVNEAITKYHLNNLLLLPSVNQDEFKMILAEFDVGLFSLHPDHKTHNFPGKLLGYMVEGLPILGSINKGNDLKDIIEEYNAGLISINSNDKLFFENAKKLLDSKLRNKIGKINGRKLLEEKFSVVSIAKQVTKTY